MSDKDLSDVENTVFRPGMKYIKGVPVIDSGRDGIVSQEDLKALIDLLISYLQPPKKTVPPSKKLLHSVVHALMQRDLVLSQKWDKTQLALDVQTTASNTAL